MRASFSATATISLLAALLAGVLPAWRFDTQPSRSPAPSRARIRPGRWSGFAAAGRRGTKHRGAAGGRGGAAGADRQEPARAAAGLRQRTAALVDGQCGRRASMGRRPSRDVERVLDQLAAMPGVAAVAAGSDAAVLRVRTAATPLRSKVSLPPTELAPTPTTVLCRPATSTRSVSACNAAASSRTPTARAASSC